MSVKNKLLKFFLFTIILSVHYSCVESEIIESSISTNTNSSLETYELSGVLYDHIGAPLANEIICVIYNEKDLCVLTDENGQYNFSVEHGDLPTGNYTIYKGTETSSSPKVYGISRGSSGEINAVKIGGIALDSEYDPTKKIIVNPPSSFTIQLMWQYSVDLDLHVIAKQKTSSCETRTKVNVPNDSGVTKSIFTTGTYFPNEIKYFSVSGTDGTSNYVHLDYVYLKKAFTNNSYYSDFSTLEIDDLILPVSLDLDEEGNSAGKGSEDNPFMETMTFRLNPSNSELLCEEYLIFVTNYDHQGSSPVKVKFKDAKAELKITHTDPTTGITTSKVYDIDDSSGNPQETWLALKIDGGNLYSNPEIINSTTIDSTKNCTDLIDIFSYDTECRKSK
tara:strand:+ start:54 stop:1229 length:1176 start_codon:yes stop_codon:yes gene_type:complete